MSEEKNVATNEVAMVGAGINGTPKIETDNWNNRLRSVTVKLEKLIPKVGGLISFLTGTFWPAKKATIWTLVSQQVTELVDRKILEQELRERAAEILALQSSLDQYAEAKLNEKRLFLHDALMQSEQLYIKFTLSANSIHLMPFAIITAQINLAVLRERYSHGAELYMEDSSEAWNKRLRERHEEYKKFFMKNYLAWCTWREKQITFKCGVTHDHSTQGDATGKVDDKLTGKTIAEYRAERCTIKDYFKTKCEGSKQRYYNERHAEMAGDLATTFLFNKYLPGSERNAPEIMEGLKTITMGPYFWEGSGSSNISKASIVDKPGPVTSLLIREYNSVDMMQVKYQDHDGNSVGNPKGGEPHDLKPVKNTHITGMNLGFAKSRAAAGYDVSIIISMEVFFSDGSTSGKLGNRAEWSEYFRNAVVDPSYALYGVQYNSGSGPGNSKGISLMILDFIHCSLLPAYDDTLEEKGCVKLDWLHVYGDPVFHKHDTIPDTYEQNSVRNLRGHKPLGPGEVDFWGIPSKSPNSIFTYDIIIKNETNESRNIVLGNDGKIGGNANDVNSGNQTAYGDRSTTIYPGTEKTIKAEMDRGSCIIHVHTQFTKRTIIFKSEVVNPGDKAPNEAVLITKTKCKPEQYKEVFKDSFWLSTVERYYSGTEMPASMDYVMEFSISNFEIDRVSATHWDGTHLESKVTLKIILRDNL
jgi:hypothetical protein